jgi:hypothetical protein
VGAVSPHKMYPVHQSYRHLITVLKKKAEESYPHETSADASIALPADSVLHQNTMYSIPYSR